MSSIVIEYLPHIPIGQQQIELVERKGLGHFEVHSGSSGAREANMSVWRRHMMTGCPLSLYLLLVCVGKKATPSDDAS